MLLRRHVYIEGRVQGVFFRANTLDRAESLGLTGWVRNLPDGRVEAVFEGEESKIKEMIAWCHQGPPAAVVRKVDVTAEDYLGTEKDFIIRY